MIPVVDFHCDLLLYLGSDPKRTPDDPICRCSYPQLKKGGVKLQILPICETISDSSKVGDKQIEIFSKLPSAFETIRFKSQLNDLSKREKIGVMLAIENASAWCDEEDDLEKRFERLEEVEREISKIVYISLTWNFENRFGGGALTTIGLKEDGKRVLDFLHGRRTAIDFSHTSDALAHDILTYIDQNQLDIPLMASHSNSRLIHDVPRNLPCEFIREIFKRQGVIGLNTIRSFVGEKPEAFNSHVAHLRGLGGKTGVCLGLDFFYENDLAACFRKTSDQLFFPGLTDSSCYPALFALCDPSIVEGISHQNALSFLERYILVS